MERTIFRLCGLALLAVAGLATRSHPFPATAQPSGMAWEKAFEIDLSQEFVNSISIAPDESVVTFEVVRRRGQHVSDRTSVACLLQTAVQGQPRDLRHDNRIIAMGFTPDSKHLITCSGQSSSSRIVSSRLKWWSTDDGKLVGRASAGGFEWLMVTAFAVSPASNRLAIGTSKGQVQMLTSGSLQDKVDLRDVAKLPDFEEGGDITSLGFSADGKYLFAMSNLTRVYDVEQARMVFAANPGSCAALDTRGDRLALGVGNDVRVCPRGNPSKLVVHVLEKHKLPVQSVTFGANDGLLLSASWEQKGDSNKERSRVGEVIAWRTANWSPVFQFPEGALGPAAMSKSGMVVTSTKRGVAVWRLKGK